MNRFTAILAVALCASTLFFSSCVGPRVKPVALFPAASTTWPAVQEDFTRGLDDGIADGELATAAADALRAEGARMTTALDSKDVAALQLVPWTSMRPWAERGIDDKLADGEIGPGVRSSLVEQLTNFTTTIAKLQEAF